MKKKHKQNVQEILNRKNLDKNLLEKSIKIAIFQKSKMEKRTTKGKQEFKKEGGFDKFPPGFA